MILNQCTVHNFRSCENATVKLQPYSLLVGPNNCGKSTIIDAIRAFYEKDGYKFKADRDAPHMECEDRESWVELWFTLTPEEHESLAVQYQTPDRVLRVRKYFLTALKDKDGGSRAGATFGYLQDGSLSDEPFYGAKNVQSGKFGDLVYIPAVSKVDEHAKLSGPSALRDLVSDVLEGVVEESTAFKKFSSDFEEFATKIKDEAAADGRSLSAFEKELSDLLKGWAAVFRLNLVPPRTAEIVKTMLAFDFVDEVHRKSHSADQFGSGFQRQFIYCLIEVASRYTRPKKSKKTKDFVPKLTLVLFEEPEAFLHPPQQEHLARGLRSIVNGSDKQVVCSTHSSHFVSKHCDDLRAIAKLRKVGGRTKVNQIDEAAWSDFVDAAQAINKVAIKWPALAKKLGDDDNRPEMEAVKQFLWLSPDRCGLFFSDHVLLVEGPSEQALVNRLIGHNRIVPGPGGVYVLDCLGKFNIHRFMHLLRAFGILHSVIYDTDAGGAQYHADIHRIIEDSADPALTTQIAPIPVDLESFLGIPPASGPHRKPQHVLFFFEQGRIAPEKLKAFCDHVQSCIPAPLPTAPPSEQALGANGSGASVCDRTVTVPTGRSKPATVSG